MNFVIKHVLVQIAAKYAVRGLVRLYEAGLAASDPEAHDEYVEHFSEQFQIAEASFLARNEALRLKYASGDFQDNVTDIFKGVKEVIKNKEKPNA
jgi:hypothetical protein